MLADCAGKAFSLSHKDESMPFLLPIVWPQDVNDGLAQLWKVFAYHAAIAPHMRCRVPTLTTWQSFEGVFWAYENPFLGFWTRLSMCQCLYAAWPTLMAV